MNGHGELFLALGSYDNGQGPQFNMTALAMRSSGAINAVSELHGQVTREMFAPLWPDRPADERPVAAITNGVHVPTWVSGEMARLFERHLSSAWRDQYEDPTFWARILDIPDEDLWAARQNAARVHVPVHPRARAPALDRRPSQRRARRRRRRDARSACAHDRLRAPLHRLQASRPRVPRRRSARAPRQRRRPARAVRLRRQGASGRRRRQASSAARLPARARSAVRRAHRVRRRLRSARRAPARAGLRRLAQHAAQAARSQRHERHEGRR